MRPTIEQWEEDNGVSPDPGQTIMDLERQLAVAERDRDLYRKESEMYHTRWDELTEVVTVKNLENVNLKEALQIAEMKIDSMNHKKGGNP